MGEDHRLCKDCRLMRESGAAHPSVRLLVSLTLTVFPASSKLNINVDAEELYKRVAYVMTHEHNLT